MYHLKCRIPTAWKLNTEFSDSHFWNLAIKDGFFIIGRQCFYDDESLINPIITTTDEILTTPSIGAPSDDPSDTSESTESISDEEENGLITWIMIFSAAGLVFIVLLVAAIIFCKRKENKRQGIPESQPLRFLLLNPKAVGI